MSFNQVNFVDKKGVQETYWTQHCKQENMKQILFYILISEFEQFLQDAKQNSKLKREGNTKA